jgi:hypothetical protein
MLPLCELWQKLTDGADKFYDSVAIGNTLATDTLLSMMSEFSSGLFELGYSSLYRSKSL